jgi:hypothetical protein
MRALAAALLGAALGGCSLAGPVGENTDAVVKCTETIVANSENVKQTTAGMAALAGRIESMQQELAALRAALDGVRELRPALESTASLQRPMQQLTETVRPLTDVPWPAILLAFAAGMVLASVIVWKAAYRGAARGTEVEAKAAAATTVGGPTARPRSAT